MRAAADLDAAADAARDLDAAARACCAAALEARAADRFWVVAEGVGVTVSVLLEVTGAG